MIQTESKYANAAIGSDKSVLQDIHIKSKNIAVLQRDISPLKNELDQIAEQQIECRVNGSLEEIQSALKDFFSDQLPNNPILLDDIIKILGWFASTSKASSFRLLLATVSTNMCRKFHTDVNDVRLLCTYIGQGTLWLPNEAVNQKALSRGGGNQEIVLDQQLIQQANTGDVLLLKGALYPDANPILHRSPSIEQTGENRLLLRIDTNEFLKFLT